MDDATAKMAEEIAWLREQQGMTFRALGERYGISPGRASYLYRDHLRRRRILRFRELHEAQNQMTVSFSLTLGEAIILQRILSFYRRRISCENSHRLGKEDSIFHDPDYLTAESLGLRLFQMESKIRRESGEKNIYPKM